jgi:hypothetical protein
MKEFIFGGCRNNDRQSRHQKNIGKQYKLFKEHNTQFSAYFSNIGLWDPQPHKRL